MNKKNLVVILSSITTIRYAKSLYVHDTKNAQDFENDKYECRLVAEQSAVN